MKKAIQIPYTFNLLNWAAVAGLFHFIKRTAVTDLWLDRGLDRRVNAYPHGAGR
jgi:hypothetical protein